MQRAHPFEAAGGAGLRAPAHGFRPGEGAQHHLQHFADHVDRSAAGLFGERDIEVALLRVLLDHGFADRGQAGRLEEARDRAFGCAHARPLALLFQVRLTRRHALHEQCKPPWRDERASTLVDEPGIDQPVGHHLLQIIRRLRLHAGGDFLGEQFEHEIGHGLV